MTQSKAADALSVYLPDSPIVPAAHLARVLGFSSREALAKARLTGRLTIPMFKIPGRRGWFASTAEVRKWLEASLEPHPQEEASS